ncbi:MAG: HAAS signaling domain-containing protein [Gaiellaceae bacterium]
MNPTLDIDPEIAEYLAAVRSQLADLGDGERDDLLSEVEASLVETAADAGAIEERLGPPAMFARELRAAAGLPMPPADASTERRSTRETVRRLATSPALRRVARDAAPLWWVARGYVAIAVFGLLGAGWTITHPNVPHIVNGKVAVALIAIAVVVSFSGGRRSRRLSTRGRRAMIVVDIVGVVAAVAVAAHVVHGRALHAAPVFEAVSAQIPPGLYYNGVPVTNIYPYTRSGELLHDVFLFDGAGRAISIAPRLVDPNRRVLRTARRYSPIFNAYPIRYFDPGTTRVSHPNAGPPVRVPQLAPAP